MIIDKILGKFGYIKKTEVEKTLKKAEEERSAWEKKYLDYRHVVSSDAERNFNDRRYLESKVEKLENKNENLKDSIWDLKERLSDEIEKRFEVAEKLSECMESKKSWEFIADNYRKRLEELFIEREAKKEAEEDG